MEGDGTTSTSSSPSTSTSTATQVEQPAAGNIAAVSIKLPPYWPADPHVWFAQIEAQFATRRITNERTKYQHVVASLQPDIAQEVRDFIIDEPAEKPFATLKAALIARTSASEQKRLQQLLTEEELGDRKPSQLLRRMRQLLGDRKLENSILKQLFLQRLPSNVQLILASSSDSVDTDRLAEIADRIIDVALPHTVAAVAPSTKSSIPTSSTEISKLREEMEQLASQVRSLSFQLRERSRSRSRGQSQTPDRQNRPASPAPTPRSSTSTECWYHETYGDNAYRCRSPCSRAPSSTSPSSSSQGNDQAGE